MLRDVRRGCNRRIGRDALQAVGNPKDQVKLLIGSMVRGNKEAVDLKFKLRDLESKWRIDGYSFSGDNPMQWYSGDFRQAFEGRGFDALDGSASIAPSGYWLRSPSPSEARQPTHRSVTDFSDLSQREPSFVLR